MKQRIHYLKKISVLKCSEDPSAADVFPCAGSLAGIKDLPNAADGTLFIATPETDLKALAKSGIPFVIYVDTLTYSCSAFFDGAKYILEGEGKFDPENFDPEELEKIYRRLKKIPWDILETDRCVIKETLCQRIKIPL